MITSLPVPAKLARFQSFLDDRLRPDLAKLGEVHATLQLELAEYRKLAEQLRAMKARQEQRGKATADENLEVMMDLGHGFLVNARIPDTSMVTISLGLGGFHVPLTLEHALRFIRKKKELLEKKEQLLVQKQERVQENIETVLNAMQEVIELDQADARMLDP